MRNGGAAGESPTLFDHARTLRGRHGPGPWPGFGDPLPDARPDSARVVLVGGGEDALVRHTPDSDGVVPPTGVELADHLEHLLLAPAPSISGDRLRSLHDLLATCEPIEVADQLSAEVRRRGLPSDGLRRLGRQLAEHGTHRAPVKIGLVLLGLGGDIRDRELLLLLGSLDELTLYAAVALHRSQPDADLAVHTLAQRVAGWGRIQAVRTLRDTTDPVLDPTWFHALRTSDRRHAAHILDLAERRLATTPDPNATTPYSCSRISCDAIPNTDGPCCGPHSPAARPKCAAPR